MAKGDEDKVLMCGPKPPTKHDLKVAQNFYEYMKGKGDRCPICLHKGKNHLPGGCIKCDCEMSGMKVLAWSEGRKA